MQAITTPARALDVSDFKGSTHITEDDTADDVLFGFYLDAAQEVVEDACNRPLTSRTVQIDLRRVGDYRRWWFPCCPVQSVQSIEWQDGAGFTALSLDGVRVEMGQSEPQLVLPDGFWAGVPDGAALRITCDVGYSESGPRRMHEAIILMVREWYDAALAADELTVPKLSFGAHRLIRQVRYHRPQIWGAE